MNDCATVVVHAEQHGIGLVNELHARSQCRGHAEIMLGNQAKQRAIVELS